MSLINRSSSTSRPPRWQRMLSNFIIILDQILMILDLPTFDDSIEMRMARLRRIYYGDKHANIKHRRVRDILRGHVFKEHYEYYEQLLSVERATNQATNKLHSGARGDDLLYQTQRLGDRIVRLIEELEDLEDIADLYTDSNSDAAKDVARAREALIKRIADAMEVHTSIPARIMTFGTAKAERGIDRLQQRIERLTQRLDDIADSYEEIDDLTDALEEIRYDDLDNHQQSSSS